MNKFSLVYSLTLLLSFACVTITKAYENDEFAFNEYVPTELNRGQGTSNPCQLVTIPVKAEAPASIAQGAQFNVTINGIPNCTKSVTRAPVILPAGSVVVYIGTFEEVKFVSVKSTAGNFTFEDSLTTTPGNRRKIIAFVNQSSFMAGEEFTITATLCAPHKCFNLFNNIAAGANPGSDFMTVNPAIIKLLTKVGRPPVSCEGSNTGEATATLMSIL